MLRVKSPPVGLSFQITWKLLSFFFFCPTLCFIKITLGAAAFWYGPVTLIVFYEGSGCEFRQNANRQTAEIGLQTSFNLSFQILVGLIQTSHILQAQMLDLRNLDPMSKQIPKVAYVALEFKTKVRMDISNGYILQCEGKLWFHVSSEFSHNVKYGRKWRRQETAPFTTWFPSVSWAPYTGCYPLRGFFFLGGLVWLRPWFKSSAYRIHFLQPVGCCAIVLTLAKSIVFPVPIWANQSVPSIHPSVRPSFLKFIYVAQIFNHVIFL